MGSVGRGATVNVLAVNAGAVTLKLTVVGPGDEVVADADVDGWDGEDLAAFDRIWEQFDRDRVAAVGHRVVHGGEVTSPVTIDDQLEQRLLDLAPLAPLHQPRIVSAIRAARAAVPDRPHVACFDTGFHADLPEATATYAVPATWRRRWRIRRYGFHGLSHAHVARAAPRIAGRGAGARVVSCHLGSGASLCAISGGRSVDTTMGFTPAEGLPMATRSGSVDPGLVLWLIEHQGMSAAAVSTALREDSGLRGLAGGSGDMRDVLERRRRGSVDAALAFDVYTHSLRRGIGAMAAVLGGLDVLAFTGGVGCHVGEVRAAATAGLGHLGIEIDDAANRAAAGDAEIGARAAPTATVVVATAEHLEIAREVRRVVGATGDGAATGTRTGSDR